MTGDARDGDRDAPEDPDAAQHPSAVEALLARAQQRLQRVTPSRAAAEAADGALLVDIRYAALRERDGVVPGAALVERNELEWRLDPTCPHRLAAADDADRRVIVFCDEGYASGLAAVSLQELGLRRVTDLVGGFQAWRSVGLPVVPATPDATEPVNSRRTQQG